MPTRKPKLSVTLIEAVVVIAIFAVIAVATGKILFTTSRSGKRLADKTKTFEDTSWAVDYMINEARWGTNFIANPAEFPTADSITFESDVDRNGPTATDPCVWYWRGFSDANGNFGDSAVIYRGTDDNCDTNLVTSLQTANTTRQELTGFVVDNPEDPNNPGNPLVIFDYDSSSRQFKLILTAQDPSTPNSQTLKDMCVALNEGGAVPSFNFSLGLVAHWPFDDGTANEVVNGINGTFRRGATTASQGKTQSLSLNRASRQYVDIPNNNLLTINSNITISAWVRYSGIHGGGFGSRFIYKKTRDTGPAIYIPASSGRLRFSFNTGNWQNPYSVTSTQDYNDGQWHLVVATYDGSSASLYVDGDLEDQVPASGNINYVHPHGGSYGTSIGRNGNEDNRWWDGLIDEVRIWDRTLPADEIRALHLAEASHF